MPKYLVQVGDNLYAYWRVDILKADLARGGYDGIYKHTGGLVDSFQPVSVDEI